ncbi:hypothetical protein ACQP3F_30995, partial [Escherichia coli]
LFLFSIVVIVVLIHGHLGKVMCHVRIYKRFKNNQRNKQKTTTTAKHTKPKNPTELRNAI